MYKQYQYQKRDKRNIYEIVEKKNATIYAHPTDLNFKSKMTVKLKSIENTSNVKFSVQYLSEAMEQKNIGI